MNEKIPQKFKNSQIIFTKILIGNTRSKNILNKSGPTIIPFKFSNLISKK